MSSLRSATPQVAGGFSPETLDRGFGGFKVEYCCVSEGQDLYENVSCTPFRIGILKPHDPGEDAHT